jgi:tetratricopeptide (TPR) repeat protein
MVGSGAMFGDKVALAKFLNGAIYESVKDPLERLLRISFLLDSPLKQIDAEDLNAIYPDGFDLDAELARVSHSSTSTSCWQISQIYQFHQRHREASQWKELAALKGQPDALFSLAEETLEEGQFANAARMFDEHFLESSKGYSLGLSSHAWSKAGEEQIAKQRMFYGSVVPQHYGSHMSEFYGDFIDDERGAWVRELARMDTIFPAPYQETENLKTAMECWKLADPIESANFGKRRTLKLFLGSLAGNSIRQYIHAASVNIDGRTRDVMGAVEARDFEAARSIFDQVNQFSPGSPSLVENIVPRLDELGQTELADYITQQTSLFFEDILVRYPNSPVNRNNYAWLLACAQRRLDTVLRHAELAVQLQPQEHTYIDTLAEAHFVRGEFDKAIEAIERSIALDPPRRYYRNQLKKYQTAKAGKR